MGLVARASRPSPCGKPSPRRNKPPGTPSSRLGPPRASPLRARNRVVRSLDSTVCPNPTIESLESCSAPGRLNALREQGIQTISVFFIDGLGDERCLLDSSIVIPPDQQKIALTQSGGL